MLTIRLKSEHEEPSISGIPAANDKPMRFDAERRLGARESPRSRVSLRAEHQTLTPGTSSESSDAQRPRAAEPALAAHPGDPHLVHTPATPELHAPKRPVGTELRTARSRRRAPVQPDPVPTSHRPRPSSARFGVPLSEPLESCPPSRGEPTQRSLRLAAATLENSRGPGSWSEAKPSSESRERNSRVVESGSYSTKTPSTVRPRPKRFWPM